MIYRGNKEVRPNQQGVWGPLKAPSGVQGRALVGVQGAKPPGKFRILSVFSWNLETSNTSEPWLNKVIP